MLLSRTYWVIFHHINVLGEQITCNAKLQIKAYNTAALVLHRSSNAMQLVSSNAANIHSESTLKTDLPIPMAREKYCLMNFKTTASERLSWRINTISKESYKQLNVPNHIDASWNEIPRDPRKVQTNQVTKESILTFYTKYFAMDNLLCPK